MDTLLSSRSHPVIGPLALPLAPVPFFWPMLTIYSCLAVISKSIAVVVYI